MIINRESNKLSKQIDVKSLKLPASVGQNFESLYYKDGHLHASFKGKKIIYYNDGSFDAQGSLVYTEYDLNNTPQLIIETESGYGQFESPPDSKTSFFSENKKLKFFVLKNDVLFKFKDNEGKTKNVYVDMINRMISSKENIQSTGSMGKISGRGFHYDISNEKFVLESKVSGVYNKGSEAP